MIAEVLDRVCVPFALLGFGIESMFLNVIEVNHDTDIQEVCKDTIDNTLKGCRCIGEPKGHHQPLIGAMVGPNGCFPFIHGSDADKVVSMTKVHLCIYLSTTQGIEELRY
ncbi:hypothetical protein PAXRUDRAFT_162960 [Paxillus rubicundulus Ve08.2h10]|uniref:Uncharacterized protein n=1 Tax=Paxillus rubicundulus Ve08.2h10 TaxID=930991 RepID=A0A0D0D5B5_9AGAM|nr:hypothetical protein PAXRUDRAFT_162960 [Paxillus rubicundulus Ve08.2h10]